MPRLRLFVALVTVLLLPGTALAAFPTDPPNDPMYSSSGNPNPGPTGQWNLFSDAQNEPATAHPSGISASEAWKVTTGRPDVVISVLDTGVDYDHADLRNKIWLNPGELPTPNQGGVICGADDCNADGVFNVKDYDTDDRVSDSNGSGARDRGDLSVFVNGIDDDGNGYIDDLSGWDSDDDDGDEFDHRFYGHGTGRAGILAPETDNGVGVAGVCPACMIMNVRIDDTFVHTSEGLAKGALYAIDNGAEVLNMALGSTTGSRMSRGVFEYATANDVVAVGASANEDSSHQNFHSVVDDVITIGGVTANNRTIATSFLQKAWFSNYGAHLAVMAPTLVPGANMSFNSSSGLPNHAAYSNTASGTSSAVPHAAGVAGLIISRARALGVSPSLSTNEVRQIITMTADDIDNVPPGESTYPVLAGWDRWTGYGRMNAKDAVDQVGAGIPPEADINSPDWYSLVDGAVPVRFYANARRATDFDYTLEVGGGVEPSSWTTISSAANVAKEASLSSADLVSNFSATWNAPVTNGLYTLRLRVEDDRGRAAEDRMAVWVRRPDPQDLPGFPRRFDGSIESISTATADLDGDNRDEVVFADGNGEIHALRSSGGEAPGFPVHTLSPRLPLGTSAAFDGNPANGEIPRSYASVIGGVAVGDTDRDGRPEVLVAASDGRLYCWHSDGAACAGFPAATDHGFSRDPYGTHAQIQNNHPEGMGATPVLGNLDADPQLEIVGGSIDQKLYVWNHDGSRMSPWPKQLYDPDPNGDGNTNDGGVSTRAPKAILATPIVADVDGDGASEIVAATNEVYSTPNFGGGQGGSGRIYLLEANGAIAPGWPVKPTSLSPDNVPLVAEGVGTSPIAANIEGDAKLEIIGAAFFGDPTIYPTTGGSGRALTGTPFGSAGPGSTGPFEEATPEGGLANPTDQPSHFYVAQPALADLDADGRLDYMAGTVGNRIALSTPDPGTNVIFDHLFSVWDAGSGMQKPAFPRVIEDWQFFTGPAVADIDGDGDRDALVTSGGFYVHAFDRLGTEPAGWPKLTGHWQVSTPALGDLNGDGKLEVVQTTRLGSVHAWSMNGAACQGGTWRKFHHDEWNTGAIGSDTRPPSAILDLAASAGPGGATLGWTAPGDDGSCGSAARYDVRVSPERITEANFGSARVVSTGAPGPSGAQQSVAFDLDRARYVAIRAIDDAGNPGRIVSGTLCTLHETTAAEKLRGTNGDGVICAGGEDDRLAGRGGDLLDGGRGNDRLTGGSGGDPLRGREGVDRCDGGRGAGRFSGCRKQQL